MLYEMYRKTPLDGKPGFGAFHRGGEPGTIRQEVFK